MKGFALWLFAALLFLYSSSQTDSERITRPTKCSSKGERFKHGHRYEYTYEVATTNGLTGLATSTTDSRLSCRVVISVPRKCELILKVLDCQLRDRIPNKDFVVNENSQRLTKELKQYPVYFQYNEGEVVNHQIAVFDSEPQHVINIKKAIISILQLKGISRSKTERNTFTLHDIFGACQTQISASLNSDHQVETYRDLLACNLSHVSNSPAGLLSFIKSSKHGHRFSPITELTYPFELNVTCKYFVTSALKIENVHCVQGQVYNPWFTATGTQGRASIQISQHIKLELETSLMSRTVDHSLTGRVWVDLAMRFPMMEESSTSQDVMEELEQTVIDFLVQGNEETTATSFSAASFRTLVDKMRGASEKELRLTKETVYSCHNASCHRQVHKTFEPKMLQLIEERLFYNGLMSCGTDSCLAVFAASVRDGLLPALEARSVVYNMGLFYQPSIKVVHIIFEHCRKTDSQGCWLSLSAMIHRLTSAVQSNVEMDSIIFEAVSHIHHMIGDKCRRGLPDNLKLPEKTLALEKLLTAIKAITNIGETAGKFYNERLHNIKSLTSVLLQCVKNDQLNFIIARSAAQAIKSIGLQYTVPQLLGVIEDEKRPLTLRTAIFDILIEHNDEATLRSLLNILNTTKMKNMQTYIMTRVSGLMESLQPEFHKLKIKLGEILKERVQLPLADNMPLRSRYAQYSHQFTVPIVTKETGGYLAVNLIYTPASSVFQSFTLETGWILDNKTVHLFDIVVDLEGMDTFLEMVTKKSSAHPNLTVPTIMLDLVNILDKYIQNISEKEMPTFAHYSSRVKMAVKEIFQLANMQKSLFPHAHLSLKVFGYEMGFISSNSLLMMIKQMHQNSGLKKEAYRVFAEGVEAMLLRAFMLFDFHKVVPTVSGFPLETRIDTSVVAKMFVDVKTDMEDFNKRGKHIQTNFVLRPSMSAILQASMKVSFGEYTSSGISTKTSVMGMGNWTGLVKYLPPRKTLDLDHDVHVTWDLEQKPLTFLNIRNDRSFFHNDEEYQFSQPSLENTFKKCLPDIYTQIFGYQNCVSGVSYISSGPGLDVSSLLVNPFKVEGVLTPSDNELNYYSLHLNYHMRTSQLQGYNMTARFEGPGRELSRQVSASINKNYDTGALDVMVDIPDAGITYNLGHVAFSKNTSYHNRYASVLSRHGKALSSFIIEKKGSHVLRVAFTPDSKFMDYNETIKSTNFNISFGALSLDVSYTDHVTTPTIWVTDVTVSYHCEPKLGLLYALHPSQSLAAIQDHTSVFSYKQQTYDSKTSFSETWKGNNMMVIILPGQNITMRTDMIADLQGAHRVTDLCWIYGNKADFIHMNSSVHNQSSTTLFNFDYFLHVYSKEKFEVDIEGHVKGPRAAPLAMLNISTDISFSTNGKKSKPFLFSFVSKLKKMGNTVSQEAASVYEATKSRIVSLWGGSKQKSDKEDTEANTEEQEELIENQKSIFQLFFESLNWNMAIDTQIRMFPHMVSGPGAGKRKVGSEIQWLLNASMPRGYNQVFMVNGSIFNGKTQSMRLQLEDYLHDLKFNWEAEHCHTPKIFQHHHAWTLEDTNKHSFDRSFNFNLTFEYPQRFEYDLMLHSPQTNAVHHINYTRISPSDHTVRAFAEVHSLERTFDLLYHESINVSKKEIVIDMNLTSTFLDHHFHLRKLTKLDEMVIEGTLYLLGRLPILIGEKNLSMSLAFPKRRPPTSEWTYQYDDRSGIKVVISLLDPNKITVGVKILPPNVTSTQNLTDSVMWTLELVKSRYLHHIIEFSPEMLNRIQSTARKLHKIAPDTVKHLGDMTMHYIMADFKDKTLPLINKSVEELLTTRLQAAIKNDHESKMAKLYKLTLGGVNVFNTIWADAPIVLLIKGSHIDQALAGSVKTLSNILMDWTLHTPFLICQFVKIYIQPMLQQVMKSKLLAFSTPLPFVMPAFNKMPQLMALELGIVKDKINVAVTGSKDIAVILDGHIIKTFDDRFFHIAEPPMPSCIYLLGADFKHGQFVLTYTREGVTVLSSRYGVTLARDGSVFTVNDHPISNLPYTSPDGKFFLSLHEGELQLRFAEGLVDVTFKPENDLYLIEFDRKLKNTSIGLLGTNNHESGDDFLLAKGFLANAEGDFQNSYELTKTKKCLVDSFLPPALCKKFDFPSCMSLSDKWPQSDPCLLVLNSQPFIDECQKAECGNQSGCNVVRAYFDACRHQGIKVGVPAVCDGHQHKSGLDFLVVQSLHHMMIRGKDPMIVWRTLLATLAHLDISVGLVTYGGAGEWKQPKLYTLNGKMMEIGRKAAQYMHLTVDTGEEEIEADAAVLAAAEYPFRSQAAKVILLVHQRKPKEESRDNSNLLEILRVKGITLVSASTYPEFESSGVQGILSARDVYELGGKIPSPQDVYSDVVTSTSGIWLDLDMLNSLETHKFKKVAEALARMNT